MKIPSYKNSKYYSKRKSSVPEDFLPVLQKVANCAETMINSISFGLDLPPADDLSFHLTMSNNLTDIYQRKAANEISNYLDSLAGSEKGNTFEHFMLKNMSALFTRAVNSNEKEVWQRLTPEEINFASNHCAEGNSSNLKVQIINEIGRAHV